jgi:beta-glucanase (GH16 family)
MMKKIKLFIALFLLLGVLIGCQVVPIDEIPTQGTEETPENIEREGYTLTWHDEFDGTGNNLNERNVDLSKWAFQIGTGTDQGLVGWGNNERQYYRSENARVEQGNLIIEAKQEFFGDMPYTSARLWTKPTFGQLYGRFEARIKLPVGDGLWPAFWLMPVENTYGGWANSGEIDIMEARGRLPNEISSALHFGGSWPNNRYTSKNYNFPLGQTIAEFHVYAVEWEPTEIRFYVNDILYHTVNVWSSEGFDYPAPFDQPFYILLNLAVGGTFDGNRLPPIELFNEPVEMVVSYVRVYRKNT